MVQQVQLLFVSLERLDNLLIIKKYMKLAKKMKNDKTSVIDTIWFEVIKCCTKFHRSFL